MSMSRPERMDATSVSLRFFGDDLDPDQVSEKLGVSPTSARRKGDVMRHDDLEHVAPTGSWLLSSERQSHNRLEAQIVSLFERLTSDLSVWRELTSKYKADLFCGLWSEAWNRGLELSADVTRAMADRGLALGFDVYFVDGK